MEIFLKDIWREFKEPFKKENFLGNLRRIFFHESSALFLVESLDKLLKKKCLGESFLNKLLEASRRNLWQIFWMRIMKKSLKVPPQVFLMGIQEYFRDEFPENSTEKFRNVRT